MVQALQAVSYGADHRKLEDARVEDHLAEYDDMLDGLIVVSKILFEFFPETYILAFLEFVILLFVI